MTPSRLAALVAFAVTSGAAYAQNMGFLTDSPIQSMTKEDLALLRKNSTEALSRNADGETSGWTNPKTGASGTATPIKTFNQKGLTCRLVRYTNHAGGFNGGGEYTLCRLPDGTWKIA